MYDMLCTEMEACAATMEGAAALGLHRVVFESDNQTLVNALKTSSFDLSDIGILLREIRSVRIASFESFEFKFSPRSCNKVAQYGTLSAQVGQISPQTFFLTNHCEATTPQQIFFFFEAVQ
jgi:hypothetical protein